LILYVKSGEKKNCIQANALFQISFDATLSLWY